MAPDEEAGEDGVNQIALTDDHASDLGLRRGEVGPELIRGSGNLLR
jgi:hypothetical protein